jgi:uncharacterized integral membrane protein
MMCRLNFFKVELSRSKKAVRDTWIENTCHGESISIITIIIIIIITIIIIIINTNSNT